MPIHFGTDGWRAVISDTFTFHNLRLVGQAIADAVGSEHWLNGATAGLSVDSKKMVVGYDTRFLSDRYAMDMARVLAANGYTVYLSQSDAPTPVISFAVRQLGAIGGVMITASHNAPRYNGVKLKGAQFGCTYFNLTGYDSAGAVTTTASNVRAVMVKMNVLSREANNDRYAGTYWQARIRPMRGGIRRRFHQASRSAATTPLASCELTS